MKRIFFTIVISFILFLNPLHSLLGCGFKVYTPSTSCDCLQLDTVFNIGDTIDVPVAIVSYGSSQCSVDGVAWSSSNVSAYPISLGYGFIINDTGTYILSVYIEAYSQISTITYSVKAYYHSATPVHETINKNAFQIYPTVSTGIFNVKSDGQYQLKKIQIYDRLGRIIFVSTNSSEINLADFSNGIYFYAIEDNKEKIYRGKLVKD